MEAYNSTLTEVREGDDVGADGYVEFFKNDTATGCCIAVQIKSGKSFRNSDGSVYYLKSDRDHFIYWAKHSLPIAGIIYDPISKSAVWRDVSEYLNKHEDTIDKGPYQIPIPKDQSFNCETFPNFINHFEERRLTYESPNGFGRSLELFANTSDYYECIAGLKSLFYYHRNRTSTWHYILASIPHISDPDVLIQTIIAISHIPGHPDIFWSRNNIIDRDTRTKSFQESEAISGMIGIQNLSRKVSPHAPSLGSRPA